MPKYECLFSYIHLFCFLTGRYLTISPCILQTSWMYFSINVTPFACTVHRFVSSKSLTMYAFTASSRARKAVAWNHNSSLCWWAISLTNHTNDSFCIRKPINFWNLQISHRVTVPSLNLPFLLGHPDLTFFLLFSTLAPVSSLSLALSTIFLSWYLRHISYYLYIWLLWPFCFLFFSFSNNYHF